MKGLFLSDPVSINSNCIVDSKLPLIYLNPLESILNGLMLNLKYPFKQQGQRR
jgi:hypothetical protein